MALRKKQELILSCSVDGLRQSQLTSRGEINDLSNAPWKVRWQSTGQPQVTMISQFNRHVTFDGI